MRLYAAADLHGKFRHFATIHDKLRQIQADAVVLAGDILSYRRSRDWRRFLENLPVNVFFVRGNSDPAHLEQWARASRNVRSLHLAPVDLGRFDLVGVSGTLPLPFHSRTGWNETRVLRRLKPMVHSRAVLVAHPPPRGHCDRVLGRFHAGSRGLFRLIRETCPAVAICGHIHEAAGMDRIGDTLVVNCALGPGCCGAKIDLEEGCAPSAEML